MEAARAARVAVRVAENGDGAVAGAGGEGAGQGKEAPLVLPNGMRVWEAE